MLYAMKKFIYFLLSKAKLSVRLQKFCFQLLSVRHQQNCNEGKNTIYSQIKPKIKFEDRN